MSSESGTPAETDDASGQARSEEPSSPICWYCQRPIDGEPDRLWRGELVHSDCYVEIRCGITVGESAEE